MFALRNSGAVTVSLVLETTPSLEESLEASALTHASRRGLLARRSPLLKLQGDAKLIAMARSGNPSAFETIVDRYQGRLLGFCRQMLGSTEDAEDVLQEVFVNAYKAMLRDEREINLRPWLYRIARNRCLNHLRKPTADAQESMDMVPAVEASSTAERVHNREEFRQLLVDVKKLPETQRSALLLREMDALSYEEIAAAMDTTVPSVKSLLVRARISLAEASQARLLTCNEVHVELSEAAEGLRKVSGPVRRHVRECEECADFRSQVRSNEKALAALFPAGALVAFKGFIAAKLGLGGASGSAAGSAGASAAGAGAAAGGAAGAGAVGGVGAAISSSGAAGGIGAIGGAIGTKAVAGVVTAAVLTAGAGIEASQHTGTPVDPPAAKISVAHAPQLHPAGPALAAAQVSQPRVVASLPEVTAPPAAPAVEPAPQEPVVEPAPVAAADEEAVGQSTAGEETISVGDPAGESVTGAIPPAGAGAGAHSGGGTVVVTVGGTTSPTTPPPVAPPATEPTSSAPPAEPATESPPPSSGSTEGEGEALPPSTEPPAL
jgi:RNA polymerase sigma factor (sigma-70 family)